jgi:TPR repeat protein
MRRLGTLLAPTCAVSLLLAAPALAANSHKGKVVEAGAGKLTMTAMAGENQYSQEVPPEAIILCDGKQCGLEDLKAAAEQGNADAQVSLGLMYASGTSVRQDDAEALKWFRKAAEQGHANAQYSLGLSYYEGKGVSGDDLEARKWFQKAAEQGHVAAQNNLGAMYRMGTGVKPDYAQARQWFRKAADQGDSAAQYSLGLMYERGEGVEQDRLEALK